MKRLLGAVAGAQLLAACAGAIIPPSRASLPSSLPVATNPAAPTPLTSSALPPGPNARSAGVAAGPPVASLGIDDAQAERALTAFRLSCPGLLRRADISGLTTSADWAPACAAAEAGRAAAFFDEQFETVQVGAGTAYATGYYEPEIAGSRTQAPGYAVPIYRRPDDLVEVDLGLFSDALRGKRITGRVAGTAIVPYFERGAIEDGALAGKGLELAWAADPVEFFFLQVQGSGRLRLLDGSVMRIGYAGQNGRDYVGIGALMRDRGLVQPGQLSMQGIMAYLRAHPGETQPIMRENKSFVFFRELSGDAPVGALGVGVTGQTTVAADPAYVPLGAPVFLTMDRPDATGLWVAQDTGGAIKGANRFDTFWGAGEEARRIAGGMSARGKALLLLPRGVLARLLAAGGIDGGPAPRP